MSEIVNCPFCGGIATVGGLVPWVECQSCGASGPQKTTEAEAITAWNTRHGAGDGEDAGGVVGYVGLITPSQRGAPDDVTIVVHTKIRHLEGLGDKLLSGPVMISAIDAARAGERG